METVADRVSRDQDNGNGITNDLQRIKYMWTIENERNMWIWKWEVHTDRDDTLASWKQKQKKNQFLWLLL